MGPERIPLVAKLFALALLLAVSTFWPRPAMARVDPLPPSPPVTGQEQRFVPGEIVVKFKDSVTQSVAGLVRRDGAFRGATADHSDSLDRLAREHGLRGARPVFRTELEEDRLPDKSLGSLRRQQQAKVEAVKDRFPVRAARAPEGEGVPDLSHVYVLELPEDADVEAAVAAFSADPHVEYAQPNYLVEVQFVPDDPYYSSSGSWGQPYDDLWGLKKIQAEQAWDVTQGAGTVVAVVDTGLDYNHPDIAANVWSNPGEVPGNGLDDDANGYVDDVRGWDFVTFDDGAEDNDPMDGHGHGTHVSGTIAAVGNNGTGIIGVAPQAKIMPLKGLDDSGGGTSEDLARALRYAADNGADVINNSWSCIGCLSNPPVDEAVGYAHGLGAVVVFSAGNGGVADISRRSPQNKPETIVVSAFDQNDEPTFFTSFGAKVDVAAPGGGTDVPPPDVGPLYNILSLLSDAAPIDPDVGLPPQLVVGGQYLRLAGTSMAAPHVSGLASLILARQPAFTNEEVRQVLRVSADDVGSPGFDVYAGRGRINAQRALTVNSVLQASITAPDSGATLVSTQIIEIRGTAAGPGFVSYQLSYAAQAAPSTWVPIGLPSTTPVVDGVLGNWTVSSLAAGEYTLNLAAIDDRGTVYDAYAPILLENPAPLGSNKVVYHRQVQVLGGAFALYVMSAGGLTKLVDLQGGDLDVYPAWSPDGSKIAFADIEQEGTGHEDIYVINADGSGLTRLTDHSMPDLEPAWSPDGAKIAFASYRDFVTNLWIMNADGSGQTRLTDDPESDRWPTWSPDGSRIAFERKSYGTSSYRIDVISADGGSLTPLTDDLADNIEPDWSPDGSRIAFVSYRDGNSEIYLMDADGSNQTRLTDHPARDWEPTWSPDGSQIAFSSARDGGNFDLYVMNADGSGQVRLTGFQGMDLQPDWDPSPSWDPTADLDGDGCTSVREVGQDPARGGRRDPNNVWDFMDQWTGNPFLRDKIVAVGDIGALVTRFGASGDPNGDPLVPPAGTNDYHTSADRSGSLPGQDPWDLLPPDGAISVGDIGAVVAQFGHSCA